MQKSATARSSFWGDRRIGTLSASVALSWTPKGSPMWLMSNSEAVLFVAIVAIMVVVMVAG